MSQGKTDFEAINEFLEEPEYYSEIMGINGIPSEPTYRQRLKELSEEALPMARKAIIDILSHPKVSFGLYKGYIPIDCDVTPLDNSGSNKEGVSWTYKGHDGYAPKAGIHRHTRVFTRRGTTSGFAEQPKRNR